MTKFLEIGTEVELICPCSGWFQGTRLRVCGIDEEDKRITYFFEDETGRKKWVYNDAWKLVEPSPSTQEFGIPCPCTKNTTIPPGKYMGLGPFFEDCRDCGGTLVMKKSPTTNPFDLLTKVGNCVKIENKYGDKWWARVKDWNNKSLIATVSYQWEQHKGILHTYLVPGLLEIHIPSNPQVKVEPWDGKDPTT